MSRLATALGLMWSAMPLVGVAAQQIEVRPAPTQGCKGTPTADSTIYDAEEAAPGPQLRAFGRLEYPTALREAGVNGGVTLAYVVNADGRVDSSVVAMSASDSAFIAPARATVLASRFWPGCRAGIPVRVQVTQSFRFEAKNFDSRGLPIRPKGGG